MIRRASTGLFIALACALAPVASVLVAPASAASPHWYILTRSAPTRIAVNGSGMMVSEVLNLGNAAFVATEAHPLKIVDRLPAGTEALAPMFARAMEGFDGTINTPELKCDKALPGLSCEFVGTLPPYIGIEVRVPVHEAAASAEQNVIEVEGGNAAAKSEAGKRPSADGGAFGVESYELVAESESGGTDLNAGSHPFQLTTALALNEGYGALPGEGPSSKAGEGAPTNELPEAPQLLRNLDATLPPGLVANTTVVSRCTALAFATILLGNNDECPIDTAIGVAIVTFRDPHGGGTGYKTESIPVFNLEPAQGEPARLGFEFEGVPITLDASLETGEGYAVAVDASNTSEAVEVLSTVVTIWGVPGSAAHHEARGWQCLAGGYREETGEKEPGGAYVHKQPCERTAQEAKPPLPYLTLPTQCTQLQSSVQASSWKQAEAPPTATTVEFPMLHGCGALPFTPSFEATPFTHDASTPTGLKTVVRIPQASTLESTESEAGVAEQDVHATTVTLPAGMLSNPGLSIGLTACPATAVGFKEGATLQTGLEEQRFLLEPEEAGAACETAKLGSVKIVSPLLERPLSGSLYLAAQDTDPFKSPLVLYLIAGEKQEGIHVKLAGEVKIDQATGQLTTVFAGTPPVPFETLELTLANEENGERAANSTPALCGPASTTAAFTPYSEEGGVPAAAVTTSSSFDVTLGPGGSPCPGSALPFSPSFQAGSTNKQAGAFTPFTLTVGHADGQQPLERIDMQLPPGMAALIADVTPCTEAQALADSCPAASLVGRSTSVGGLGGKPVTLRGQLYFTGPLKATNTHGASPFGLLDVTPVEVGPFVLEPVKVLSTIDVNEETAAAIVKSEQIPQFVQGVPAQLKQLSVTVERPGGAPFQFNPTNCERLSVAGELGGWEGALAGVSEAFYASNCASLPFQPKLTATVVGQGSKANGTTFAVKIESPGLGQANLHKLDLTIPASLPSRLTTIQKACPEAAFNANPGSCDEGSVIGEGIVRTPVFGNPLKGPAYLVSHGNAAFPDVEFVLQGEGVTLIVDGKTYIHQGITYSKFESSPDAPFTSFESIFPAGPHSALTPNVPERENFNLCSTNLALPTEITGQNGAFISQTTKVAVTGCKGAAAFKATKAQLLARALKACRKDKQKSKRIACEQRARKRYGATRRKVAKKR